MHAPQNPKENRLLAVLSGRELQRLEPHLERVHVELSQVLRPAGKPATHIHFPTSCIVSNVYFLEDGGTAEISVTGNEGVIGFPLFMGDGIAHSQAVVQGEGDALRLPGDVLEREFYRAEDLQKVLLRYVQALFTQTAQTAICNRHHTIEQQLARWLLLILDRLPSNEVHMTQELIAEMLGVRREGVTVAAHRLREEGIITYQRGHIVVNDRSRLEAHSCECYEVVKKEYDRLLRSLRHLH